jgi:hypothetical protein
MSWSVGVGVFCPDWRQAGAETQNSAKNLKTIAAQLGAPLALR